MSTKDKDLVAKARRMHWEDILGQNMEEMAASPEAKQEIHQIMMRDYRRNEE